jgi:hypothetical protein
MTGMTILPRHVTTIFTDRPGDHHKPDEFEFRVVILHQAAITLAIGGVLKPVKPGEVARMLTPLWNISHRLAAQADTRTAVLILRMLYYWNIARSELLLSDYTPNNDARSKRRCGPVLWRPQRDHTRIHRETWRQCLMG